MAKDSCQAAKITVWERTGPTEVEFDQGGLPDDEQFQQVKAELLGKLGIDTAISIAFDPADPDAGRYGTDRDLTAGDVRAIVKGCRKFQGDGGKVTAFLMLYQRDYAPAGGPRSFALDTLRGWLKDPRFRPKDTQ